MSGEGDAPYNIYAKQLFPMRHGYPLWHPEIERDRGLEVQIGDVGYLHEGVFIRIFNATLPREHPDHARFGAPSDHEPFRVGDLLKHESRGVIQSHLCSRSVRSFGLEGSVAIPTTPVGAGMKFQCSDEQGAFVFMNVPADKTQMLASHSLIPFIRHNIDRWHEFAQNEHDLEIARDQIVFVSGATKTEDWGLGAFVAQARGGEVAFNAQVPFFQGTFSVQHQRAQTGNIQNRAKPPMDDAGSVRSARFSIGSASAETSALGSEAQELGSASELATPVKRDQTLFFHYYKVKARWWIKRIIKAAAGPDERDMDRSVDGEDIAAGLQMDDEGDVVQEPQIDQAYDPVDYLLDYILNYPLEDGTEVQVAIASDLHIYALFDGEIPLDIKEQLEKLRPPVMFMDDNREVACLAIAEWGEELPEGDVAESKAAGKQKDDVGYSDDPHSSWDRPQEGDAGESKNEREDKDRLAPGIQGEASIVFQDHTGGVTCIAFSPDGRYLASGSEDTTVILRDGTTGVVIRKLTEHNDAVWALTFSPDSTRMCTGANDGMALIWDLETTSVIAVLDGHTGVVQTINYSHDGLKLVTSSVDFSVRIWDATSGTLLHKLDDHKAVVMSAVFSPDGKWVASCGADYKAKIWDAYTGALKHSLDVHTGVVWSVAFSPDSRRLVTGSDDMTSRIWRVETGEELVILHEHQGPVWCVAFSPQGKYVMSASNDATIKVCDSYTSERVHAFDRHDTLVNTAVFSPDGRWIASSVGDNAVMAWNVKTGKNLPVMQGHLDKVTGLQFSPESDRLVSCSDDGTLRIWTLTEHVDQEDAPEGVDA